MFAGWAVSGSERVESEVKTEENVMKTVVESCEANGLTSTATYITLDMLSSHIADANAIAKRICGRIFLEQNVLVATCAGRKVSPDDYVTQLSYLAPLICV